MNTAARVPVMRPTITPDAGAAAPYRVRSTGVGPGTNMLGDALALFARVP